jgi:hypothetical protein
MQSPKFFLIDSRDRISGSSHNFSVEIKPGISPIKTVKLCGLVLPLTNYIVDTSNQNIYFSDGTDYIAILTPGIYDYVTILTEIKSAMEATAYAGTITAIYDVFTFKFTIVGTIAFSLTFETNTSNSAAYLLGFNLVDTGSATSHTGDDIAHLSIPPYFYINIDSFNSQTSSTNSENSTFVIFSQNISGYVNFHWHSTHYPLVIPGPPGNDAIQFLNINIRTRGGDYLNLNDTDWQMLLEFEY